MDKFPKASKGTRAKEHLRNHKKAYGITTAVVVGAFFLGKCTSDGGGDTHGFDDRVDVNHSNNTPGNLDLSYTGSPRPWTTGPMFTANNPRPTTSPTDIGPSISPFAPTAEATTVAPSTSTSKPNTAKCAFTRNSPAPLIGKTATLLAGCTASNEVAYPKGGGANVPVKAEGLTPEGQPYISDSIDINCKKPNFVEGTLTYANGELTKYVSLPYKTIGYAGINSPAIPECK